MVEKKKKIMKQPKKVFHCVQHPKTGRDTQHSIVIYKFNSYCLSLRSKKYQMQ